MSSITIQPFSMILYQHLIDKQLQRYSRDSQTSRSYQKSQTHKVPPLDLIKESNMHQRCHTQMLDDQDLQESPTFTRSCRTTHKKTFTPRLDHDDSSLSKNIFTLINENMELKQQIKEFNNKKQALQSTVDDENIKNASFSEQSNNIEEQQHLQQLVIQLQDQIMKQNDQIQQLKEHQTSTAKFTLMQQELENKQYEILLIKQQLQQKDQDIQQLKQQNQQLQLAVDQTSQNKSKIQELYQQIQKLNIQLDQSNQMNRALTMKLVERNQN